jgi:hypothetical protein
LGDAPAKVPDSTAARTAASRSSSRALGVTIAFDAAWPSLAWMGVALIVLVGLLLAAGAVLILVPVRRIRRS